MDTTGGTMDTIGEYTQWTDAQWELWHAQTVILPIDLFDQLLLALPLLAHGRRLNSRERRCWEELHHECQPYLNAVHNIVNQEGE